MSDVPEMMIEMKMLKQEEKVNFLNIKGHLQEIFFICADRLPPGEPYFKSLNARVSFIKSLNLYIISRKKIITLKLFKDLYHLCK